MFNSLKRKATDVSTTPPTKTARTMQVIGASEASRLIDQQINTARLMPPPPPRVPARAPLKTITPAPAAAVVAGGAQELSAADRAMMRKQKEETHQYGRRHQMLLQWLLLGKMIQQSTANAVVAEAATDLAKWNEH